ncbi:MAG: universal stress protein [Gemmatimonadaceae bacterium]
MKLLVPLDTSTLAEQAVPVAAAIAKARKASEIRLVVVHERLWYARHRDAPWNDARSTMERAYLESKAREVGSILAIPVIVEHPTGGVVDAIAEITKSAGTDLIVMTTHGRTGMSRAWLGSVADGIMRSAGAPVLMLRPSVQPTPVDRPAGSFSRVLIPLDGSGEAETILDEAMAVVGRAATYVLVRVVQPIRSSCRARTPTQCRP